MTTNLLPAVFIFFTIIHNILRYEYADLRENIKISKDSDSFFFSYINKSEMES